MKIRLRVRLQAHTKPVEVDENVTVGTLKKTIAQAVFSLNHANFDLSLNGRDALDGTDNTLLSQYDVVSGDLIHILTEDNPSLNQVKPPRRNPTRQSTSDLVSNTNAFSSSSSGASNSSDQNHMVASNKPSTSGQRDGQQIHVHQEPPQDIKHSAKKEDSGPKLWEPMLCREATASAIPLRLRQLLIESQPTCQCETLCVALHVLMIETGFLSKLPQEDAASQQPSHTEIEQKEPMAMKDVTFDNTSAMPSNWKASKAAYNLTYTHPMCEAAECSVAWVPLGTVLMVHALTGGQHHFELQLTASDFVISQPTGRSTDDCVPYKQLGLLSRRYKDEIAHPLLEAVRAELGLTPLHGLMALVPEIQLLILSYLNVSSLLGMSEVCTHFQSIAADMSLWRQLMLRGFGGRITDGNCNWKELYKQKYRARKEMQQARSRMTYIYPPLVPPHRGMVPPMPDPMHPMFPPGYRGGDYDRDPFSDGVPMFPGGRRGRLPNAGPFPGARHDPIFPESDIRPGQGGGLRDMRRSGRTTRDQMFPPGGGGFGF